MGRSIHEILCEYLLLQKHPNGLKDKEFISEFFCRGWPDRILKDVSIARYNEEGRTFIEELKELGKKQLGDSVCVNLRKAKNDSKASLRSENVIIGDVSWIVLNVYQTLKHYHSNTSELRIHLKPGENIEEKALQDHPNYAEVFYDLKGDKKYRIYPGSDNNPDAWTHYINFLEFGEKLARYESWVVPDKERDLSSNVGISLGIAKWFCNKFNRNFYDICQESYEYLKNCKKFHIESVPVPSEKLKDIGPDS